MTVFSFAYLKGQYKYTATFRSNYRIRTFFLDFLTKETKYLNLKFFIHKNIAFLEISIQFKYSSTIIEHV